MLRRPAPSCEIARRDAADAHRQVEPIAQRTGQPRRVARDLRRRASARAHRVAEKAARARIHRADQHEARGEDRRPRGARDAHHPFLDRLTQHFEHVPAELRHLVEEQDAVMREADLARAAGAGPPPTSATSEIV